MIAGDERERGPREGGGGAEVAVNACIAVGDGNPP